MKKFLLPVIAFSILTFTSCSVLNNMNLKPSSLETVMALKNILDSSTFKALKSFKDLNDGGVSSVLPGEVNSVLSTLKTLGYSKEVDQVTNSIGNASKIMLTESEGIIGDAISELTFTDAVAVVLGGEDAATNVLKRAMYETVKNRYSVRIEQELGKTEALDYWPIAAGAYNVFAKEKVNSSLPDFLAERSVDAVFLAMGKQEASIRTDYKSLGNSVVTKVFDYYSKNKN
jgi:hypothetical protein